jgi:hypothetical protein
LKSASGDFHAGNSSFSDSRAGESDP